MPGGIGPSQAAGMVSLGTGVYQDFASGNGAHGAGTVTGILLPLLLTKGVGLGADAVDLEGTAAAADGGAGRAAGCLCACSFAPQTPVLLANGKTKAIAELKVGDKVESADPTTGKDEGTRTVQHVWTNHDDDLLDVTVNTGHDHTATIHTTANHPFYDDTTQTWVAAGDLKPGGRLKTTSSARPTIATVKPTPGTATRYNLTISDLHTYYVLAGNMPVLVHNTPGGGQPVVPNIVQERIAQILAGGVQPRPNGGGTGPDRFEVRGGQNPTPGALAGKWGPSAPGADDSALIYDLGDGTNRYRILVNRYGDVGWVDNHNYNNIRVVKPNC